MKKLQLPEKIECRHCGSMAGELRLLIFLPVRVARFHCSECYEATDLAHDILPEKDLAINSSPN